MSTSIISPKISSLNETQEKFTMPANKKDGTFTLTIPTGWKFLAVLGCSSSGWAGLVYTTEMGSSSMHVVMENVSADARDFWIHYLIYK